MKTVLAKTDKAGNVKVAEIEHKGFQHMTFWDLMEKVAPDDGGTTEVLDVQL